MKNWNFLPKKALQSKFGIKTKYDSKDEALREFHILSLMFSALSSDSIKSSVVDMKWANSTINTLRSRDPELYGTYDTTKYEIQIEDIVNALNDLEEIVAEYFNLDTETKSNDPEDPASENIDPENRHLGEPGLAPATINENVTNEVGRKSPQEIIAAIKDLLSELFNPQDIDDNEAETDPEAMKDSSLVRDEEHPPSGDPRTSPEALEDLEKESPTLEHREVLPGENASQDPNSLPKDEGSTESDPINGSNEESEPLQSSGEAYLSMPKDVIPEEENNEEEKEKASSSSAKTEDAEQGSEAKATETQIIGEEDDEDEEEGGVGGENNTPAQVGWFDSKNIDDVSNKKGLNYKASGDGMISCKSMASFSNFGKASIDDYQPTDEELAEINSNHSLITLSKKDIIVLPITAADTDIDRGGEHFTKGALESFVPLYKGKALLLDHNWTTGNEVGRIFDARVVGDDTRSRLVVKAYIPNTDFNQKLIKNMMYGVHSRASVGFSADVRNVTCDSCSYGMSMRKGPPTQGPLESSGYLDSMTSIFDEENCPHKPGALDEYGNKTTVTIHKVADVMELSFVPVPMQPKAGTSRALSASTKSLEENTTSSTIISSRTKGENAVSDLTASREGHENEANVPAAAEAFNVEANETRPTDDNIFARAAIKNLHDISESLKSLTSELVASQSEFKALLEEFKALKAKPAADEEMEEDKTAEADRVKILEEATKTLTEALKKQLESAEVQEAEVKSSCAWASELVHNFNKSLGS